MEPIAQLKTSIYELLTQDATLQTLFDGTVKLENTWPEPDEQMPYLVYRASSFPAATFDVVAIATLAIDLWDANDDGSRISQIRQRVSQLLEGRFIKVGGVSYRVRKALDQEIEEEERYVWHIAMTWSVRYTRQEEMVLEE